MLSPQDEDLERIGKQVLGVDFDVSAAKSDFRAYFKHYRDIFCPYSSLETVTIATTIDRPALQHHADVLRCIQTLATNPTLTRDQFGERAFQGSGSSRDEKQYATKQVVSAAFMINCTSKDYYSEGFQSKTSTKTRWEADQAFVDFVRNAFDDERLRSVGRENLQRKKPLKAWKLVKRNKIKIRATNNLLEHLHYDPQDRVLKVFHQTMFLQAQLKRSRGMHLDAGFEECLRL